MSITAEITVDDLNEWLNDGSTYLTFAHHVGQGKNVKLVCCLNGEFGVIYKFDNASYFMYRGYNKESAVSAYNTFVNP